MFFFFSNCPTDCSAPRTFILNMDGWIDFSFSGHIQEDVGFEERIR